ncbi:MAG: DUF1501 domain-containing protein [Planctomycetota bacterium]|jgi:hypothetical protein
MTRQTSGCTSYRNFARQSRRDFLRVGSLAIGGLTLGDFFRIQSAQAEQKWYESKENTAKSVIQIVCQGGIAAQESWNPKPEAPLEYRGPFGVAKTPVPGFVLSEKMAECAKVADRMCFARSLIGGPPDHGLAMYHMLSGRRPSPAIKHPSVGAVVNHEFGSRAGLPGFISIPDSGFLGTVGTGYLSPKHGAFSVGGDPATGSGFQVRDLRLPNGIETPDFDTRRSLRDIVNGEFAKLEADPAPLETMDSFYQQAYTMISSPAVRDAFDLSQESDELKKAYGFGRFLENGHYGQPYGSQAGMRMLLARRLVEAGARFVSLTFGGWDDHTQIRENYEKRMPALDNALAMLIRDLDDRGLLDSTLVWVASEFGRTPKINASAGRDHWSRVFSTALAGGGLKRGLFYGDSDATSSESAKNPTPLEDLHATLYHLIGINSDKELMAPGDRPIEIVDGGSVIDELIA